MTIEEARHLLSRTGFGAAPHEIAAFEGLSYAEGVQILLDGISTEPTLPMPAWTNDWLYPVDLIWTLGDTQADLYFNNRYTEIEQLGAWWLAEMAATPSPLTERLVLFWSDHFANSFEEHENSQWMANQNAFFRSNAAGNFADLAHGILRDPAMLDYLDNTSNLRDAPNENLGREFLELFTLGEGRGYTQDDVRAAARALTGYTIGEMGAPRFIFDAENHDTGDKTLFGQTGAFDAEDLADMALGHPEFGPYIIEGLWLTFISDQPDPIEVARLAQLWRDNDLEIRPLLKALFLTEAFWAQENRGRLIKSPVELLVGTIRTMGYAQPDARELRWTAEQLGQSLFLPPNVGGWPVGVEWINDATASGRATSLTYMLFETDGVAAAGGSMMMQTPTEIAVAEVAPNDLRVGQVFVTYVEERDPGAGNGGLITLFDVSFQGETWRSIPIWLEFNIEDSWAATYPYIEDCETGCLTTLPSDGNGWVAFDPIPDMIDDLPEISTDDRALMQALGTHLPTLLASAREQVIFTAQPDDPYFDVASFDLIMSGAELFSSKSETVLGAHEGEMVIALSRPGVLGLAGFPTSAVAADPDVYAERLEEDGIRPIVPAVTYLSSRDWINALPGTGLESERAAAVLLAVPRMTGGQRDEMIASDPEALIRSLILSPEYQVH